MSEYTLYLENVFGINNTDYNLCAYVIHECILCSIFLIQVFSRILKCIGKQLLSDHHKSFAISIRIRL